MSVQQSPSETAARPEPARWSRPTLVLGLGLIGAGLAILGWLGWEFFGTNWVSHRTQARVIATLHQDWEHGQRITRVSVGGDSRLRAWAIIQIPRFGPGYQVPVLEGTSDAALAAGFGHFPGTAPPGGVGNFALAGHRITHGEPLRDMPDLQVGDRILVQTRTRVFTYVLDTAGDALTVPFTATWITDPVPTNSDGGIQPPDRSPEQHLITLTTCSELFHTDNRLVAFGHLARTWPVR
jgi:sortase A